MQVQSVPLPPDVEYCLDCAVEGHDISSACHSILRLFGDRKTVIDLVDIESQKIDLNQTLEQMVSRRRTVEQREEWHASWERYAFSLISELTPAQQDAAAALGILSGVLDVNDICTIFADWFFVDSLHGGCLEHFRGYRGAPILHDRFWNPTKSAHRRLRSPRAIRRYVKNRTEEIGRIRSRVAPYLALPMPASPRAADLFAELFRDQQEAAQERRRRYLLQMQAEFSTASPRRKQMRGIDRNARKVIRKSAAVAEAVLGRQAVSAFASGGEIELLAGNVTLAVAPARGIRATGHGALAIQIRDERRNDLAKLCFYIEKTPVFDQLAALAMHADAGAMDEILETGNLYAITSSGYEHDLVKNRELKTVERAQAGAPVSDRELQQIAVRAYTEETRPVYMDAVMTAVFGRAKRRIIEWGASRT